MTPHTISVVTGILRMDPSVTEEHLRNILLVLRNETAAATPTATKPIEKYLTMDQVAEQLGKSKATIERYCRRGLLRRVVPRGGQRAIGVTLQSFRELADPESTSTTTTL